ncbi:wis1 [Candida theae]|uniref:mitogen-activated protein kinase kinase n=1 Tax=Candida theae TaxID=1198502 RepID=A0AAD5FX23_9ASCO|nr:wis1 [Candida theae]KAI5950452.1 wis1 [Candida theae]
MTTKPDKDETSQQFGKLSLNKETDSSSNSLSVPSTSATSTASTPTPSTAQPQVSSPPMTPSVHTPLSSDIQARLLAFQQKRSKPASEPMNVYKQQNATTANVATSTSSAQQQKQSQPQSLAPPIPPPHATESKSDSKVETISLKGQKVTVESLPKAPSNTNLDSAVDLSKGESNPTSVKSPPLTIPSGNPPVQSTSTQAQDRSRANPAQGSISSPNFKPQMNVQKKPSLSQRRGMKLNTSAFAFDSPPAAAPASPPSAALSPTSFDGPLNLDNAVLTKTPDREQPPDASVTSAIEDSSAATTTTANNQTHAQSATSSAAPFASAMSSKLGTPNELSRRLSERKKKPNFKLNLDSPGSNIPSRSSSLGKSNSSGPSSDSSPQQQDKEPQLQGLFANYSKYIDIKSGQLNFAGKASLHSKGIDFSSGSSFHISLDEFEYLEELGRGNYGSVSKVLHKPTGVLMAMKEVRLELDETKFTQILMELDILHKCDSPYIVDFYGAFFVEGAVYMCIEYMDGGSLDRIFGNDIGVEDEGELAYITESVIRGLKELKDEHNIIHRDVKPTNILVNSQGKVKLCDFGVSGNLVASMAKTNIGCQSYMAPERIKSLKPDEATYSVQSDVWSLGLTILELAVGHYPYPAETYDNIFSQLSAIVDGEPPKLDATKYSKEAQYFVKSCLNKNPDLRPSYAALLHNPWLVKYRDIPQHLDKTVQERMQQLKLGGTAAAFVPATTTTTRSSSATTSASASKSSTSGAAPKAKPGAGVAAAAIPQRANNAESVNSLLKKKVRAPALHRGGLPQVNNKSFLQNLNNQSNGG